MTCYTMTSSLTVASTLLSAALLSCPHQGAVSAAVRFPEDNLAALRPQLEGVNPGEILNYNRAAVAAQYERSSPRFEHPNGGQFPTKVSWRDRKTSGDQQHWRYRSQDDIRLRPTTSNTHWGHEPSPDLAGDATVEFFKSIPVSEGPRDGISPISPSPMVTQSIPRASHSYIRGNTGRPQTSVEVIRSQEVEVKDFWKTPPGSIDNHRAVSSSVSPQNTRPFRNTLDTWTPFSEASSKTQHFLVPPHSDSDGDLSYTVDSLDTSPFRPRTNPPSPRPVDSSTMFVTPAPNEAPRAPDEESGIPSVKSGAPYEAPGASYGEPPARQKSTKRPSLTTVLVKKVSLRPPKGSREPSHFTLPQSQSGPSFWKHTAEAGFPSVPSQRDPGNHIFVESDVDLDMSASSNDHSVRWERPPPREVVGNSSRDSPEPWIEEPLVIWERPPPQEVVGNSSRDSLEPWIEEHLTTQVADLETQGNSSTPLLSPRGPSPAETTERGDQSSVTLSQSEQNQTRLSGVGDETPPGNTTTRRPPVEQEVESKDTQSGEKAEKPSRGPLPVREYNESLMIGAGRFLLLESTPAPPGRRTHKEVVRPHMEDMRLIKEDVRLLKEDVRLLKEDMRPHKKEVRSHQEDVRSHKEDVRSHKEEVRPPKEEVIPHKKDVRPQKEEMRQNQEEVSPPQEEVRPYQGEVRSHH